MAKKSISKNYLYNVLYEILTLFVPLITTPYISRILGAEGIGIYSYNYSIVAYFTIVAALGTTVYARREIAYLQDDIKKRSILFWDIFLFRLIMTVLCLLIYLSYAYATDNIVIGLIQSFYILSVAVDITWFFQGMEDFGTVVLRGSLVKIINIAFIFLFIRTSADLTKYIFGLSFIPFIGNLMTWPSLIKYINKVQLNKLSPFKHFKGAILLFIPTIASQVYLLLDKTMIGLFASNSVENGYYEQAQKIIMICWTFLTTFSSVMAPRIAATISRNELSQAKEYIKKSFSMVWFLATPIAFGVFAISGQIVPWFFGDGFSKVRILLQIFSWIVFPVGISSVIGNQYLVITKKHFPYTLSIIIGAVVNFSLNLLLIPRYFSIGAAISSVIAEVFIAGYQFFYITHRIKFLKYKDIFSSFFHCLISGLIMYIIVGTLSMLLQSNIINTFILIGIGAIIYGGLQLLFRDEIIMDYIEKIKMRFKKKVTN